jgi:hypothetical protein
MSETTTWYEIKGWGIWEVKPLQVVKVSAKSLVVLQDYSHWNEPEGTRFREVRKMFDGNQFDSLEAANAAVVARYENKIKLLEGEADDYRRHLANWIEAHK